MSFTESHACRSRLICVACRRGDPMNNMEFPAVCPFGVTLESALVQKPVAKPTLDCIHRGAVTRMVECKSCGGNVQAKVMECSIHGECSLFSKALGVKRCQGCGDRVG